MRKRKRRTRRKKRHGRRREHIDIRVMRMER